MGLRVGGCPQRDGGVGGWRLYDTVLGGPGGGGVWWGDDRRGRGRGRKGGGYFNDLYDAIAILLLGVDVMLILAGNVGC